MKLFQQLLVAGAAASMIAPLAAQATNVNLEDMNSYSNSSNSGFTNNYLNIQPGDWAHQSIKDLAKSRGCDIQVSDEALTRFEAASIVNSCLGDVAEVSNIERTLIDEFASELALIRGRVDGIEARMNEFEAGSFSDTTTLDGKAVMVLSAVSGNDKIGAAVGATSSTLSQAATLAYAYQMNLNTSFTGDDNLYVRLKTGAGWGNIKTKPVTYHNEVYSNNDSVLRVDKIWYNFPIGDKVTATVGPLIENYYMLAATPSVYKPKVLKAFRFGGHGIAFGASTSVGLGLKYQGDNGFATSATVNSKNGEDSVGFLTKGDQNKINLMGAYTADNYHLSATYTKQQRGWTGGYPYFATKAASQSETDTTGWALRGWWRPDDQGTAVPSVSVGYDTVSYTTTNGYKDGSGFTVGLNWNDMFQADDTIGLAFGQPIKGKNHTDGSTKDVDPFLWEAYYSFKPNDSIEITPGIFGGTDAYQDKEDDVFGAVVTTTFRF
tara:strand:- start:51 stop:1526 length:1476 start_codon:yes stop_codon:yes gene_type:complete